MRSIIESLYGEGDKRDLYLGIIDTVEGIAKGFPEDAWRRRVIGDEKLDRQVAEAMTNSGLMGLGVPEQYGGLGEGLMGQILVTDMLGQKGLASFASILAGFCRAPALKYGTQEQIEKYVLPTIGGEKQLCILATEPDAGTNTFRIKTKAEKKGNKWVLNGQKTYITEAAKADYGFLIAKTGLEQKGALSIFMVDMKSPGIELQKLNISISGGESQYTVFLNDVEMSADALIGQEGMGGMYMFEGLNAERLILSAWAVAISDLALSAAVGYVQQRVIFGDKATGSYQAVQHPLAQHKAETDAARLMTYMGVKQFDEGVDAGMYANMAKLLSSQAANNMCDAAIQFHGGSGMDEDMGMLGLWRASRAMRIAPINNEMVLNFIAEHGLGLPKSY